MSKETYIVGEILATFFENPKNFYKVILVRVLDTNASLEADEIVLTGIFGSLHEEMPYRFIGTIVTHPKYGQQFSVTSYQQNQPTGFNGLVAYFSSDRFPGIGKKTAEKMIELLGEEAIERIIHDETTLEQVPGLSQQKRDHIRQIILENQGTERLLFELTNLGITATIAQKMLAIYKEKALTVLQEDPYQFLQTIDGIGFRRIDAVAQKLEIPPDSLLRLKGALFTVIRDVSYQSGHTYVINKEAILNAQKLLEMTRAYLIDVDLLVEALNELIREGVVISEGNRLSLASLFYAEVGIANSLKRLVAQKATAPVEDEQFQEALEHAETKFSIRYDASQRLALKEIIQNPVFILTGGPGTGKTTIINGVIEMYHYLQKDHPRSNDDKDSIQLAAPTGRAAKRMNEVTGLNASTIHRLLGISADEADDTSDVVGDREVLCEFLIIDELSMVDTWLMNRLLKAVSSKTKLLFVGDNHQLPSVGPGQVLEDLLQAQVIPFLELTHIHRQEDQSSIVSLAHAIKQGQLPADFALAQKDRSFIPCRSSQLLTVIEQIVTKALQKGYTKKDIQVLAPMYKGEAGIHEINRMMQQLLNPKLGPTTREIEHFDRVFRVGDKVLQLVNVAEENIYNGDIGEITAIIFAKENEENVDQIFVAFDAIEVVYSRQELQQLTHAYCCSIHKAQGSEFNLLIVPMVSQYQRMLQRNLLYTAVTRSKQFLILCGQYTSFQEAAHRKSQQRQTYLAELLTNQALKPLEDSSLLAKDEQPSQLAEENGSYKLPATPTLSHSTRLTQVMIAQEVIDPMIGMESVTPYTFMN